MERYTQPRRYATVLLVVAMVSLAGCSFGGGNGNGGVEGTGTAAGTADGASPGGETATGEGTAETTETGTGTSTGTATGTDEPTTNGTDNGNLPPADAAEMAGRMTVLVGPEQVQLSSDPSAQVWFNNSVRAWYANESLTVAEALETAGVQVNDSTFSYQGETYQDGENTYVTVRVNEQRVDPTEYTLKEGDEVWVFVSTPQSEYNPPGQYIRNTNDHIHGTMEVVVNGEQVNFTQDRYQSADHFFHFEGGDGTRWHAHSWEITLEYALEQLNMSATESSFTYNGTTYEDSNADVQIRVNGEPVNPEQYRLMEGDQVRIVVEGNESS